MPFRCSGARLAFGDRVLWDHLDLSVSPGEFIAVLGPNGSGKTSLLKVLLGQLPLSAGVALVDGKPITSGSERIGYVPQHRPIDRDVMLRGRDLVRLGVDGRRWGATALRSADRARRRAAVRQALRQVNGEHLADVRVGVMSGGELQRVRIAQALASDPMLLLCDEPLLTLDPANAKLVSALIDRRRRDAAHHGHRRHPRGQHDPAVRGPGAVPGRRPIPDRHRRAGDDHRDAVGAIPGRHPGGEGQGRLRGGRATPATDRVRTA